MIPIIPGSATAAARTMDTYSLATPDVRNEDTDEITRACAKACGVGLEVIEKIGPASEEQVHRLDHHISTGSSFMTQMVLHYEGNLNQNFLLRALTAIRFKNHILRTRLIMYEGQIYQVVLRDSLVFQQVGMSLDGFLAQNSNLRMGYGTPLFRIAFVREAHGESFFVWSAHSSAVDAWTLRLMFDDLQAACSDLEAYYKYPPRPPYGRYARWLASPAHENAFTFWRTHHTAFDNLAHKFPVLAPKGTRSTSTTKAQKLLHLPKVENTAFSLIIMGYAAWAITILKLSTKHKHPLTKKDISFLTRTSARRNQVAGMKYMMGPISARVPIRIALSPNTSIDSIMRDTETQLQSMGGLEHCAMKALSPAGAIHNAPTQALFTWNPPGSDISSKRIICFDKEVAPAVLAYREDLSVPFAHDYGLWFEVYEYAGHIAIHASWDRELVSEGFVSGLVEDFGRFLILIVKRKEGTIVRELLEDKGGGSSGVDC